MPANPLAILHEVHGTEQANEGTESRTTQEQDHSAASTEQGNGSSGVSPSSATCLLHS